MDQWYYVDASGEQQGPVDDAQLQQLVQSGKVAGSSLVWKTGMPDWVSYSSTQTGSPPLPPSQATNNPYATPATRTQVPAGMSKPDSYMVQSILVTLFCCLPFGIVAIVSASQVDSKWSAGDFEGAKVSSDSAKKWTNISFFIGLVGAVLYFLLVAIAGIQ